MLLTYLFIILLIGIKRVW